LAACVLGSLSIAVHGLGFDNRQAVTVSFLTLAFGKLWFVYNLRSQESRILDNAVARNPYVAASIAFCSLLLLAAAYLPGLSLVLRTQDPTPGGWILILGMSLVPLAIGQILMAIKKAK
jgi:Ca2+-transporting ATPase